MSSWKKLCKVKRILAMFLAVALTVPTVPVSAYAAPETETVETVAETESTSEETTAVESTVEATTTEESTVVEEVSAVEEEPVAEQEDADVSEGESTPAPADVYAIEDRIKADDKVKVYTGYTAFDLSDAKYMNEIVLTKNGDLVDEAADVTGYSFKWQAPNAEGTYADMAADAVPVNAGKYRLVVTLPKVDGKYDELKKEIDFEITKAPLTVSLSLASAKPGSLASDVQITYLVASSDTGASFSYTADNKATADVNENANSQLTITKKVIDSIEGTSVSDNEILSKSKDYTMEVSLAFSDKVSAEDKTNYSLPATVTEDIAISNLIDTQIQYTLGDKYKEAGVISKDYTGKEFAFESGDYTAKVVYADGYNDQGEVIYKDVADATLSVEWEDYNYDSMKSAPVDAGTYYCVLNYEGKDGIYNSCTTRLQVKINQINITIRPKFNTTTGFYVGTKAGDVLSKVEYDVYDAADQKVDIDVMTFWGNQDYESRTFPYEPVFVIQRKYKTEEKDDVYAYETLSDSSTLEKGKEYYVTFSGDKAVYRGNGEESYRRSINYVSSDFEENTDINYSVKVDEETLVIYTAPVVIQDTVLATVSANAILDPDTNAGWSYENPITKVYDGKPLYETRAEYKKAVVTAADGATIAKDADSAITYTWYQASTSYQWNEDTKKNELVTTWSTRTYRNAPTNAGNYKLAISYKDKTGKYAAETVDVYYCIEKQTVKVVPTGEYSALTDSYIYDFLDDNEFTYKLIDGTGAELDWDTEDYTVEWKVEQQTDAEKDTWETVWGTFAKDKVYRLAVSSLEMHRYSYYANYTNYTVVIEGEGENATETEKYLNDTLPISLKLMGTTELEVVVSKPITIEKEYDGTAIDIAKYFNDGSIKLVQSTGETVSVNSVSGNGINAEISWYDNYVDDYVDEAVNGGTYTLAIEFKGDETYKAFGLVDVSSVTATINKKDVVVTPVLENEVVTAGTYYYNVASSEPIFEGVIEKDLPDFTYCYHYGTYYDWEWDETAHEWTWGWPAFDCSDSFGFSVYDNKDNYVSGKLAGNKEYTVKTSYVPSTNGVHGRNYKFTYGQVTFTTVRGNAAVEGASIGSNYVTLKDTVSDMKHVIVPMEGIPYCYNLWNGNTKENVEGNYLAVRIYAPAEYNSVPNSARYENTIKAAGGFNVSKSGNYITAVFDASALDTKEFKIRWEEGYTETFVLDLTKATLLADLSEAQAPKSISLMSPATKMAVGGKQQLDVKLVKAQESDTIRLAYKVDDNKVLCVNDYGYITALSEGKATVTVYSVKRENGEMVPTDPVKEAKVTITVNKVSAPKGVKAVPYDTYMKVIYNKVSDGYRREFYVLEGKNKTVADFETAIASMNNGRWQGIFATAPVYGSEWNYVYNKTKYTNLNNLEPNKDYTVYVRNVSAVGDSCGNSKHKCEVTHSYAGSVKSFTTTKVQVSKLSLTFNNEKTTYNEEEEIWTVPLSAGKTKVVTSGQFKELAQNVAADPSDTVWYTLPLTKELKKYYVDPKLTYYVGEWDSYRDNSYSFCYEDEEGYYHYFYPSSYLASVDKKGNVKLNGVGKVSIVSYDTTTGCYTWNDLLITASADSITGKTAKLQVGESMYLGDLLTYKEGRKVLKGNFARSIVVDETLEKVFADSEHFKLNGNYVTAVKEGGNLRFELKDALVGKGANVTLKSTALQPVKSLKTTVVTDQFAKIEFTHTGKPEYFRIQVKDARGSLMTDKLLSRTSLYNNTTRTYAYTISGLTQKSKYNVTVTAVVGDVTSKAAKKSIKTTALPASYISLSPKATGGITINVKDIDSEGYIIGNINYATLVAGNKYTLDTDGAQLNKGAKYAKTDTLTWTSSNKKVATVKALGGSYTATLQAIKSGTTVIEVKSKITKAVIARYEVEISAVGNAYDYYGSNENLEKNNSAGSVVSNLALNSSVYVSVNEGEYKWLKFTAPYDGYYVFRSSECDDSEVWLFNDMNIGNNASNVTLDDNCIGNSDDSDGSNFRLEKDMVAGQTVYLAVGHYNLGDSDSFNVMVSYY